MNPFATIQELKKKLEETECSAAELTQFFKKRLEKYNHELNTTIEIFENQETEATGVLSGIPGII
ncbi:hypothetical protein KAU11_04110, partial [Candidatus Babeliales bacterium]|nr:hypothetical protein [Candidatus Babeliales bacterium]